MNFGRKFQKNLFCFKNENIISDNKYILNIVYIFSQNIRVYLGEEEHQLGLLENNGLEFYTHTFVKCR